MTPSELTLLAAVTILSVGLVVISAWFYKQLAQLDKRLTKSLGGAKASNLEAALASYFDKLNATSEHLDRLRAESQSVSELVGHAFQKSGLVRFNPFRDTGGDQSFALCLLDSHDCGLMLTAVHGREGTRVYAKSIQYGQSQGALSSEEQAALAQAQGVRVKKPKSRPRK